jgi:hypothetical protein
MVPAEKIPEPWPPSLADRHHPLCNGPAGGWRAGRKSGRGTTRGFFNQGRNSSPRGMEPGTWRCYSEALLTITLEALSLLNPDIDNALTYFFHGAFILTLFHLN